MAKTKNILVTGSLGFIGFHLVNKLLNSNYNIIGIDNINNYYDLDLKVKRKKILIKNNTKKNFKFYKLDISEKVKLQKLYRKYNFNTVIHLAAQAGVRYSITNPDTYGSSNLIGFLNILECCRIYDTSHLIFASSSSIYGKNKKTPFSVKDMTDQPVSLYAATKKSNELMAYSYSSLYNIQITGLRFFTVYGPYGRPDMAYYDFTKRIIEGKSIQVFNYGKMKRDFTYIDDIIDGINKVIKTPPSKYKKHLNNRDTPFKIFNFGNNNPVSLNYFISLIEKNIGKKAKKKLISMQLGDVKSTFADTKDTKEILKIDFKTKIEDGIHKFVKWYINYTNN